MSHEILQFCLIHLATYCFNRADQSLVFYENQLMYSANQRYAFGIVNGTLGIYGSYANGTIGSSIWSPKGPQPSGVCARGQADGNFVL